MSKKEILKKILSKAKKNVTDKVGAGIGTVMSIPSKYKGWKAETDLNAIKTARSYDKAPSFETGKGITDAGKAKFMANVIKEERKRAVAKKATKSAINK